MPPIVLGEGVDDDINSHIQRFHVDRCVVGGVDDCDNPSVSSELCHGRNILKPEGD